MRTCGFFLFATVLFLGLSAVAQTTGQGPPVSPIPGMGMPPGVGSGLPWPQGLGRRETITGHIGAIDKDQIMVRSPDIGEVLFWVDDKTVVRVEKFRLALSDLRVGDPVAVKLKKIKGRGPYATEILPHPDVKTRKEKGEERPKPAAAPISTDSAIIPATPAGSAAAAAAAEPATRPPAPPPFPSLPAGVKGVIGTVASASGDSMELRDQQGQTQKVLLTGVTLIKRAGTEDTLPSVKTGERVAVAGDLMDSGEWIAREVYVAASASSEQPVVLTETGSTGQRAPAAPASPAGVTVSPDGLARFSGLIVSVGNGEIHVRTPSGERTVLVSGITNVKRMGMRRDFAALKQGDQVDVVGDVLEGGSISAREVTVTKLAGS